MRKEHPQRVEGKRIKMILLGHLRENGICSFADLVTAAGCSDQMVRTQIMVLSRTGLVFSVRRGNAVTYELWEHAGARLRAKAAGRTTDWGADDVSDLGIRGTVLG